MKGVADKFWWKAKEPKAQARYTRVLVLALGIQTRMILWLPKVGKAQYLTLTFDNQVDPWKSVLLDITTYRLKVEVLTWGIPW